MFVVVEVKQHRLENDDDYGLNKLDDEVKFENVELVGLMFDLLTDDVDVVNDDLSEVYEHLLIDAYNLMDYHLMDDRRNAN
jgi:hypothetical protein